MFVNFGLYDICKISNGHVVIAFAYVIIVERIHLYTSIVYDSCSISFPFVFLSSFEKTVYPCSRLTVLFDRVK